MPRQTQNAEIQALYREVNERIASLSAQWSTASLELCASAAPPSARSGSSCRGRSTRRCGRSQPTSSSSTGMRPPASRTLIGSEDAFLVVANDGDAATVARRTDPRANDR
jgi:hypothetical protein